MTVTVDSRKALAEAIATVADRGLDKIEDAKILALVTEAHRLKRAERDLKVQREAVNSQIKDYMKSRGLDRLSADDESLVELQTFERTDLDRSLLARLAPKALAKATKVTAVERLLIK